MDFFTESIEEIYFGSGKKCRRPGKSGGFRKKKMSFKTFVRFIGQSN
jgi:hypothetical protein